MVELLSEQSGARLVFASSHHTRTRPKNLINDKKGAWLSTGLFPQVLVFDLGQAARIASVNLKLHKVKRVRLEVRADTASSFVEVSGPDDLLSGDGLWSKCSFDLESNDNNLARFIRLTLIEGHDAFVGLSGISVVGKTAATSIYGDAVTPTNDVKYANKENNRDKEDNNNSDEETENLKEEKDKQELEDNAKNDQNELVGNVEDVSGDDDESVDDDDEDDDDNLPNMF